MFTGVMGLVMTNYFGVHQVLVMQGVLLPVNAFDNVLVKKYIFGDKSKLYDELTEDPTNSNGEKKEVKNETESTSERVEILSETSSETSPKGGAKKRAKAKAKATSDDNLNSIDE